MADPVVIVGAGLAGMLTALHLAPRAVTLITAGALGASSSSEWAQGGIAAAVGADDSPALHLADTLAAGAGLCDPLAARRIVEAGPEVIEVLVRYGVRFDREAGGALQLGLEAAHGRRRIVHAAGDGTGREIVRALAAAVVSTPSIRVLEGVTVRSLTLADGRVCGLTAQRGTGTVSLRAARVVVATGGLGGLFRHTTNPLGSWGAGIALAARAGAALRGMEFVQFHPTALDVGRDPMPLVSEAVRGEGATLIDGEGIPVMAEFARGDLEPRDVVSREVWRVLSAGGTVRLDARRVANFARHFPGIAATCQAAGIDPATQPIPVRPAAHYHMGGIAVDGRGRSTVPGLWACGEASCTGLHGANRLASNSLLEAAACARFVAADIADLPVKTGSTAMAGPARLPPPPNLTAVRTAVSRYLGVLRDADGLTAAIHALLPTAGSSDPALVALLIAVAALRRPGRIGSHWRTDGEATTPLDMPLLTAADALTYARQIDVPPLAMSA